MQNLFNMTHEQRMERFRKGVEELVQQAAALGIVITVENVPLRPLAMGAHVPRVEARSDNAVYRGRWRPEEAKAR